MKYKCFNIQWDTDNDQELFNKLPKEICINAESEEDLTDLISDEAGFCHFGFEFAKIA